MGHSIITKNKTAEYLLSYIRYWWKAGTYTYSDAGITPCVNNDAVYRWCNSINIAENMQQTTSANRPIYKTGGLGNQPYISFVDTTDILPANSTTLYFNYNFTVTFVVNVTAAGSSYKGFLDNSENGIIGRTDTSKWGWTWSSVYSTTASVSTGNKIITFAYPNAGTGEVWINGSLAGTGTVGNGQLWNSATYRFGNGSMLFDIYEMIVLKYFMPSSEITILHTYLNSIYGIY